MKLKALQDQLLNLVSLKGFNEITKVTFTKYNEVEYDPKTGSNMKSSDNWMIETDGVAM